MHILDSLVLFTHRLSRLCEHGGLTHSLAYGQLQDDVDLPYVQKDRLQRPAAEEAPTLIVLLIPYCLVEKHYPSRSLKLYKFSFSFLPGEI